MDIEAFTHAINNGLGRAVLWLRHHPWRPYEAAITHVCLHNTAYDAQCEGSRAEYVYDIIRLTDSPETFAEITAKGLLASKDYWDTYHLYHLARLLAQGGDTAARDAVYAKFRQDDAQEHFIGSDQIFRLDGMSGGRSTSDTFPVASSARASPVGLIWLPPACSILRPGDPADSPPANRLGRQT